MKFILVTGYDITDEIQSALNSNLIMRYFSKPYNKTKIKVSIDIAVSEDEC